MNGIWGRYIQVKYSLNKDLKYVELKKFSTAENAEMCFEDIVLSVVTVFGISRDNFLYLRDKHGNQLSPDLATALIFQFVYCCSFTLELCTIQNQATASEGRTYTVGSAPYVTIDSIKEYITSNGGGGLLRQYTDTKSLSDSNRRLVIRILGRYLVQNCGSKPSKEEKFAVAKAAVGIFDCYKSNSVYGGAEIFFNPVDGSGWIVAQLKNLNFNAKKYNATAEKVEESGETEHYDATDDLQFLKCAVLPDQIDKIKILLRSTVKQRKKLISENVKLVEQFPFFFVDPTLITFDFELSYTTSNILKDKWPVLQSNIFIILKETGNEVEVEGWNMPTLALFGLIKLLPSSKGKAMEKKFNKFLIFKTFQIPKEEYIIQENKQPYIVAVGPTKSAIDQYFIVIEGQLICLPSDYNIIDAFNVLFCSIFIFSLEYEPDLKTFFTFFEHYVYKLSNTKKISPRLLQICTRLDFFEQNSNLV